MVRNLKINSKFKFRKKLALYALILGIQIPLTGCKDSTIKDMSPAKIEQDIRNNANEGDFGFVIDGEEFVKFCIVPKTSKRCELFNLTTYKPIGVYNKGIGCIYSFDGDLLYSENQIFFFNELSESTRWDLNSVKNVNNINILKQLIYQNEVKQAYSIYKKTDINTGKESYFVGKKIDSNVFYDFELNKTFINESYIIEELFVEKTGLTRQEIAVVASKLKTLDVEGLIKQYKKSGYTVFKKYLVDLLGELRIEESQEFNSIEDVVTARQVSSGLVKGVRVLTEVTFDDVVDVDVDNEKITVNCEKVNSLPDDFYTQLDQTIESTRIKKIEIRENHYVNDSYLLDISRIDFDLIREASFIRCPIYALECLKDEDFDMVNYDDRNNEGLTQKITFSPSNAQKIMYIGDNENIIDFSIYYGSNAEEISITYLNDKVNRFGIYNSTENDNDLSVILAFPELNEDTIIDIPGYLSNLTLTVNSVTSLNAVRNLNSVGKVCICKTLEDGFETISSDSYDSLEEFCAAADAMFGLTSTQSDDLSLSLRIGDDFINN